MCGRMSDISVLKERKTVWMGERAGGGAESQKGGVNVGRYG